MLILNPNIKEKMFTLKALPIILTTCIGLSACGSSNDTTDDVTEESSTQEAVGAEFVLAFASVPSDGTTPTFEIATTETPNSVYAQFLTEAYAAGVITYDSETQLVLDSDGQKMTDLSGYRVINDHNGDGVYVLDEMENPLNINFINFNSSTQVFEIEDPATIDWSVYFDTTIYPNVVDQPSDWFEFEGDANSYVGEGDLDGLMPSLDEIKTWPANFITYHGAKAFADFYGYELPSLAQWRLAAAGGSNFTYSTSDGTRDEGIAWINIDGPLIRHRGHVQPVDSKFPNPLGIYHMGGNVWEWVHDWYDGNVVFSFTEPKQTEDFFIDDTITFDEAQDKYLKGLIGGSFNYFPDTMRYDYNHAAMPATGNDHFGFRVVKKP